MHWSCEFFLAVWYLWMWEERLDEGFFLYCGNHFRWWEKNYEKVSKFKNPSHLLVTRSTRWTWRSLSRHCVVVWLVVYCKVDWLIFNIFKLQYEPNKSPVNNNKKRYLRHKRVGVGACFWKKVNGTRNWTFNFLFLLLISLLSIDDG